MNSTEPGVNPQSSVSPATSLHLVVRSARPVADDVVELVLDTADQRALPSWQPGAHVDVRTPSGPRSYSLCGSPSDPWWQLAIQRESGGRGGSRWIHDAVREGMQLTVSKPRNNFPLLDAESYLFLAGGIGITPLLPMVEELCRSRRRWQLMYGARSRTAMAYADRLTERRDHISLWPEDELGRLPLDAVLAGASPGTAVYCCGPTGMIEAVQERCDRRSDVTLHVERFAAARREDDADGDESFTLVLARSGLRLEVPAGQSILQVVEDAGLIVACSCCEGTCGTCETKIIEGHADHRDSVLTPAEHAAGDRLMICVSRARTPELVLDL